MCAGTPWLASATERRRRRSSGAGNDARMMTADTMAIVPRSGMSEGAQPAWRPGPVDRGTGRREGSPATGLGRAEDEDSVRLRRLAGLGPPQLRHLPAGRDIVEGEPRESVALGLRGTLPDPLGEADGAPDGPAAIRLHVADHQDDHRSVGEDPAQIREHLADEDEVRL